MGFGFQNPLDKLLLLHLNLLLQNQKRISTRNHVQIPLLYSASTTLPIMLCPSLIFFGYQHGNIRHGWLMIDSLTKCMLIVVALTKTLFKAKAIYSDGTLRLYTRGVQQFRIRLKPNNCVKFRLLYFFSRDGSYIMTCPSIKNSEDLLRKYRGLIFLQPTTYPYYSHVLNLIGQIPQI